MDALRRLADIQADIAAAAQHISELEAERRRTREVRCAGIVADFDAGLARAAVAAILHKARRTERSRHAQGLDLAQRADYERLIRYGVRTRIARAIALRDPS